MSAPADEPHIAIKLFQLVRKRIHLRLIIDSSSCQKINKSSHLNTARDFI